jgi:hypothetical protein
MLNRKFTLTFLALAGCAAFAQTTTNTVTRTFSFAPVGLAPSETAQVTLLNTASNSSSGTAASCTGTVAFFTVPNGSAGAAIGTATSFTVGAGVSSLVKQAGSGTARQEIRSVITLTATIGVPCALEAVLETYDTGSGATHARLDGAQIGGFGGGH